MSRTPLWTVAEIARVLFFIFIVLFLITLISHLMRRNRL